MIQLQLEVVTTPRPGVTIVQPIDEQTYLMSDGTVTTMRDDEAKHYREPPIDAAAVNTTGTDILSEA